MRRYLTGCSKIGRRHAMGLLQCMNHPTFELIITNGNRHRTLNYISQDYPIHFIRQSVCYCEGKTLFLRRTTQ